MIPASLRFLLVASAAVAVIASVADAEESSTTLDPGHGVVFAADKAISLAKACSRSRPGPIEATWTPTRLQIDELEARLPAEFARETAKAREENLNVANYFRQYGGLQIGGRRIIYVNAFLGSLLRSEKELRDASKLPPGPLRDRLMGQDWHKSVEDICDGGVGAFGVEYDPNSKSFESFEFDDCMCTVVKKE